MVENVPIEKRLNEVFEARIGRVLEVYQEHKQLSRDKRLYCSIEVFPAGEYENVPFWGGGFDLDEDVEMPHGFFCPPRPHQYVLILFINGNFENPVAAAPIPHPHDYSFVEKYYNLVESVNDIGLYHYSGTRVIMREDGSIDIQKRIEESEDNFVNHTLKIEIEYDEGNDIRKKTITDVDNDVIIELTTEDVSITDTKDQHFKMHSVDDEEYVEFLDKAGQKGILDSTKDAENIQFVDKASQEITMWAKSGENYIQLKRGDNQLVKLENNKNTFKQSSSQYIEQASSSTDIKGTLLNLLGATQSFIKGDILCTAFTNLCTTIATATSGDESANASGINTIKAAFATFAGLVNSFKSTTIKGE